MKPIAGVEPWDSGDDKIVYGLPGKWKTRLKPDCIARVRKQGDVVCMDLTGKLANLPVGVEVYFASADHVRKTARLEDVVGPRTLIIDALNIVRSYGAGGQIAEVRGIVTATSWPVDTGEREVAQ